MRFRDAATIICFTFAAFLSSAVCQAPADCNSCCTTYKEINDPRRSIKSVWKHGQDPLCDRGLRWGWYRFTSFAGAKMPEKKVPENHCGTQAPIWLDGSHPTKKGENVARRACVNVLDIAADGCYDSFNINIINCGDYFVYYLRPPWYCAVAYCAGKLFVFYFGRLKVLFFQ